MTDQDGDATAHYKRRSAAFYRLLTEGTPEGFVLNEQERVQAEEAHRLLGRAIEEEVFNAQGEGSTPDDVQAP